MEGWSDGGLEWWRAGVMEGWSDGGAGVMESWSHGRPGFQCYYWLPPYVFISEVDFTESTREFVIVFP